MRTQRDRVLYAEVCNVDAAEAKLRKARAELDLERRSNVPGGGDVDRASALLDLAIEGLAAARAEQRRVAEMWAGLD